MGWRGAAAVPPNSTSVISAAHRWSCQLSTVEETGIFSLRLTATAYSAAGHGEAISRVPHTPPCALLAVRASTSVCAAPSLLHPGSGKHIFAPKLSFFTLTYLPIPLLQLREMAGDIQGKQETRHKIKLNCKRQQSWNKWRKDDVEMHYGNHSVETAARQEIKQGIPLKGKEKH